MEEENFEYEEPEGASTADMSLSGMLPSDYHEVYHDTREIGDEEDEQEHHQSTTSVTTYANQQVAPSSSTVSSHLIVVT